MPRPRIFVPQRDVVAAYESTGSIRGAARHLHLSRWVVQKVLAEAGVVILDRETAMTRVREISP